MRRRIKQNGSLAGKTGERLKTGGILAAFLAAVVVFAVMVQTEKKALAQYEKSVIYTAVRQIPSGMLITADNREQYFKQQELDVKLVPATAVKTPEELEGLVPVYDMEAGTLATSGMFESLDEITATMQEPCIVGFKADDMYQVVGGILRAGDRIHVYSVSEEKQAAPVFEELYIQGVFDQSGTRISNEDELTAAQRVNVYLDKKDVSRFYSELAGGSLRVVKTLKK